ncbi:bordetella uptake domain-containing protein (plasmid) [Rhizobium gallicum]|uniref:Bordetella uptake domain-containing protein n=1 Tax=Rhizobium gallicum TaxID=56730 RepID=A0A1L5NS53_9HYPH|nr:tripartite tricarboxylate transporter substrate binding protein [Rhizobium gallicum]APO70730.1 bordetella uptake domain-containing protein [Rhizobium gallicum]
MKSMPKTLALVACIAIGLGGANSGRAQEYPNKPIRMVIPVAPGGITDAIGRIFAESVSKIIGQQVVVDNRPGGNGSIGANIVAKASPDGYVICWCHSAPIVLHHLQQPDIPYDPETDLLPITRIYDLDLFLAALPSTASSLDEFIKLAKSKPGELSFGSTGVGGALHLGGVLMSNELGIQLSHVAYPGEAPLINDLLGGRLPVGILSTAAAIRLSKSGEVALLTSLSANRTPTLPDVPTLVERGYPDVKVGTWIGVFAPAKTPEPVARKLIAAFENVLSDESVKEKLLAAGVTPVNGSVGQDFKAFLTDEVAKWKGVLTLVPAR